MTTYKLHYFASALHDVSSSYERDSGRRVPVDEVEPRGDGWVVASTGTPVHQIVASMSKTLRNVVNPDDVIEEPGADTFRLYEMFMSPLADGRSWDSQGISGCRRFLERLWRVLVDPASEHPLREELRADTPRKKWSRETLELERALNRMLKRVDDSFASFNFNTAVAAMMSFVNEVTKRPGALCRDQADRLVWALAPFAPHFAEELWSRFGHQASIATAAWPAVDAAFLEDEEFELVVQVLGRVRGRTRAPRAAGKDELESLARRAVAAHLEGKELIKTVVVPGRLVNFVVR